MECPVCYEDCHKTCNLVCGHGVCMSCVRGWWERSQGRPTCPMCRQNLYFRGMRHVTPGWVEESPEHDEEEWDNLCTHLLDAKRYYRLPWVRLVEPPCDDDDTPLVVIYTEFPINWFPPARHTLNRPRGLRGFRGDRHNWLEE